MKEFTAKVTENLDGTYTVKPIEEKTEAGLWKPEKGETCFYVTASGEVHRICWEDRATFIFKRDLPAHDNCFKTRDLARKAAKLQRISNLYIAACLQVDPEFGNQHYPDQEKWFVNLTHDGSKLKVYPAYYFYVSAAAYVSTEEKAEQVKAILEKVL